MLTLVMCLSELAVVRRLSHQSAEMKAVLRDLAAALAGRAVAAAAVVVDLPGVVGEQVALVLDDVLVVCVENHDSLVGDSFFYCYQRSVSSKHTIAPPDPSVITAANAAAGLAHVRALHIIAETTEVSGALTKIISGDGINAANTTLTRDIL